VTPNFAVVGIQTPHGHGFNLWLPLFLLWIPALLLSPLILLLLLGVWIAGRFTLGAQMGATVNPWHAIAVFWGILCSLPGTHVRVSSHANQILIRIL
jgi:hypothetical protein